MQASLDDLLGMAMFARVVEARSFTAAAAILGVSKSVVSTRVAALEDSLGVRLLSRTTRRLALTEAGVALYERCARLVAEADEAAANAAGESSEVRGVLRVNAPVTFAQMYLGAPIADFLRAHPRVTIDLTANDRLVDLVEERVDVAVRITRLVDSVLVARKLGTDRARVCASPAYLAARGVPRGPEELAQHDCLRYAVLRARDEWRFASRDRRDRFEPVAVRGPLVSSSGAMLREAALAGVGLAVLPTFMIHADVAAGRLVTVLDDYPTRDFGIYALHAQGRRAPAKVRAFVDHLAARFRRAPWSA